jgi:pimeloyl-ACP methyl ester carboxylesterase
VIGRRAFLVGGAATVGLAAAGIEVVGTDRVLHKLGLRESPDHRVPSSGWAVVEGSLPSKYLGRHTALATARPPGDATLDGALVCLHGFGGNHRYTFDTIHVHDVVAAGGYQIGVAAVDGGRDSYWHARKDGTDAGRMVLDELVPHVRQVLAVERVAVLGWSMGGYGALLLSEQSPGTFVATVASSPALFPRASETAPGAFDDAADFAEHDVFAGRARLDRSRTRIDCGDRDPFVTTTRSLVASLTPGISSSFPNGYHDAPFWRSVAPRQIAFVAKRLRA